MAGCAEQTANPPQAINNRPSSVVAVDTASTPEFAVDCIATPATQPVSQQDIIRWSGSPSRNIELKARCDDLAAALAALAPLSPVDTGVQHQIDTYFRVPNGRLKLREIVGVRAELIWYDRSNQAAIRKSDYRLTPIAHPADLKTSLAAALGLRGKVEKHRQVLLWHNVRIHLDLVEELGTFIEFEAVIGPADDEQTGHYRLKQLCEILKLTQEKFRDGSYADLLGLD
jgi:adenylate cyclase class IV